jgi:hypothetical protein
MVLTLEIHHLEQVADGGSNDPSNLLPLCPNCHTLHHTHVIPLSSLRAWKHLLLALNQVRISAIVDARFSLIVDGETASSRVRRGGAQAPRLNVP